MVAVRTWSLDGAGECRACGAWEGSAQLHAVTRGGERYHLCEGCAKRCPGCCEWCAPEEMNVLDGEHVCQLCAHEEQECFACEGRGGFGDEEHGVQCDTCRGEGITSAVRRARVVLPPGYREQEAAE